MKTDRELLQDAFDALEAVHNVLTWYEQTQNGDWFLAYSHNPTAKTYPLYRHPRQPVRLSDDEIIVIAEKYGISETYPQTDWEFSHNDLLAFARELLSAQTPPAAE